VHTARDEIRRVKKWGPQEGWHDLWDREIGAEGSSIDPEMFQSVDVITSVHTLYYYSRSEILKLLKRGSRNLLMEAVVHKFGGNNAAQGELNNGEQTWTRKFESDGRITIQQPNVETGQNYSHPDNSWLFNGSEWREGEWVLGWDINKFTDECYFVTLKAWHSPMGPVSYVKCAGCGNDKPVLEALVTPPDTPQLDAVRPALTVTNSAEWLSRYSTAVVKTGDRYLEFTIAQHLHSVFTNARSRLLNKPRTMEAYKSHSSLIQVQVKRLDTSRGLTTSYEEVADLTRASFWMDLDDQLHLDTDLFNDHWKDSRVSEKLYLYGHHGAQRHLAGTLLDGYMQGGGAPKGVVGGLLGAAKSYITAKV